MAIDDLNGGIELYVKISNVLPSGYTQVEYIESTGTQYIDTGFIHSASTKIEIDCYVGGSTTNGYQALFGSRNTNYLNNAMCFFTRFGSSNTPTYNRSGVENKGSGFIYGERITVIAEGKVASWYKNGELVGSVTTTGTADSGVNPMFLFNLNTYSGTNGVTPDTSYIYDCKMYRAKIYDNGILVRDFIPCTNSNGIAGMYDLVNDKFCTDVNGGTFVSGGQSSP